MNVNKKISSSFNELKFTYADMYEKKNYWSKMPAFINIVHIHYIYKNTIHLSLFKYYMRLVHSTFIKSVTAIIQCIFFCVIKLVFVEVAGMISSSSFVY